MSAVARPVFLSYSRRASSGPAKALAERLGRSTAFLDIDDIELAATFPVVIRDAMLDARVFVVFVSEDYFRRPHCSREWRLALAPWRHHFDRQADPATLDATLAHILVVLPDPATEPTPPGHLPPSLRQRNWPHAGDLDAVVAMLQAQLDHVGPPLRKMLDELGIREAASESLERSELLPPPAPLTGRVVLDRAAVSLADRFVGRERELYRLEDLLSSGAAEAGGFAATTGALRAGGGFGKSRLALEYVWRYQARDYPGGVFWIDADVDAEGLEMQWHSVLRTLEPEVPELAQMRAQGRNVGVELDEALRRHLLAKEGPWLVVLDNVPEPSRGEKPAPLDDLFPGRRWVTLLVTSRRSVDEARTTTLIVDVLDPRSARQLLLQGVVHRDGVMQDEWDEIAAWVGRLPLALELLNRALVHMVLPARELYDKARGTSPVRASDAAREALAEHVAEEDLRGISEAFEITFDRLPEDAGEVARASASFGPAPLPAALVDALCAGPGGSSTRATLVGRSVWNRVPGATTPSWSMHRLVADFLRVTAAAPLAHWRRAVEALNSLANDGEATDGDTRAELIALVEAAGALGKTLPGSATPEDGEALRRTASWLEALGRSSGVHLALVCARRLLEGPVSELLPREAGPERWATTQNLLGTVLRTLGSRTGDEKTMQEAITAYRAALEVRTRAADPEGWSAIMSNLGTLARAMGERRSNEKTLEEAVGLYRAALEVRTREAFPTEWAATKSNLGNVLRSLGARREDDATLEEAVMVLRAVLKGPTSDTTPRVWATTQHNLGNALCVLGQRREDARTLEEAVAAHRAALEVLTRDSAPASWARIQVDLGAALQRLAEHHRAYEELFQEAIDAYGAALEVHTRKASVVIWAVIQNNLGVVYQALGERRGNEEDLQQAALAYGSALEVFVEVGDDDHIQGVKRNLREVAELRAARGRARGSTHHAILAVGLLTLLAALTGLSTSVGPMSCP